MSLRTHHDLAVDGRDQSDCGEPRQHFLRPAAKNVKPERDHHALRFTQRKTEYPSGLGKKLA
jgi:hypothetical protein